MSWITPGGGPPGVDGGEVRPSDGCDIAGSSCRREDLDHVVATSLHPHHAQPQLGDGVPHEATYDLVRDAIAELGLGMVRMERRRHHMVEIFTTARGASDVATV